MHFFLPVNRNRIRFVVAVRLRVIVKVDFQWRAGHGGDRMMRTFVECRFAEDGVRTNVTTIAKITMFWILTEKFMLKMWLQEKKIFHHRI